MTRIGVMGAGAIGCYVGGRLAASGADVVLVGRQSIKDEVAQHGLHFTDYRGLDVRLAPDRVRVATSPEALADRDVVIVTVKGGDTTATGSLLANVLRADAVVVSLQNGVSNPTMLRAVMPARRVLGAMVPFNVLRSGAGRFHQGTSGRIAIENGGAAIAHALVKAGVPARAVDDIDGILWGKLLVNLNNAVNALAGVPIQQMLKDRGYRVVMAAVLEEAVKAVEAAGIRARLQPPVPARLVARIFGMPDALFGLIAPRIIKVDPEARSSMWDDLVRGRKTEIDSLNGEIVRLAARVSVATPVNDAIVALVKDAEGKGSPNLGATELRARVTQSLPRRDR